MRKLIIVFVLCMLPFFAYADLTIHFVDVGHGDCTILVSNGEAAIVDGGPVAASEDIFNYIRFLGLTDIKYAFATHPQTDHVGGLPAAFHAANVHGLFASVDSSDNERFNVLLETAASQNVPFTVLKAGDRLPLGDSTITVMSPAKHYNSINDMSLVLRITSPGMDVLLCGDASANVEQDLLKSKADLTADVIRVGHHGSATSTTPKFLAAVSPRYAVISSSEKYGDQQRDTMIMLIDNRITTLSTDFLGTFALNGSVLMPTKTAHAEPYPLVGNKKSLVLHYGTCESVADMKEHNKVLFFSFEEAAEKGYKPCKRCYPTQKAQP